MNLHHEQKEKLIIIHSFSSAAAIFVLVTTSVSKMFRKSAQLSSTSMTLHAQT